MIEDARVLRDEFIPREVEHRDPEVNHLASVLAPITDGRPADTALITGRRARERPVSRSSPLAGSAERTSTSTTSTSTVGRTIPGSGCCIAS